MDGQFHGRAFGASLLINSAAFLLAIASPSHSHRPWPETSSLAGRGGGGGTFFISDGDRWQAPIFTGDPCGYVESLDQPAVPRFPLFLTGRPFAWLDGEGEPPVICILIGRSGGVVDALIANGSGSEVDDRAMLAAARLLRFQPALRAGRPVPSWGRLIVNRRDGFTAWRASPASEFPPPIPDFVL